jgi:hypothetical protein
MTAASQRGCLRVGAPSDLTAQSLRQNLGSRLRPRILHPLPPELSARGLLGWSVRWHMTEDLCDFERSGLNPYIELTVAVKPDGRSPRSYSRQDPRAAGIGAGIVGRTEEYEDQQEGPHAGRSRGRLNRPGSPWLAPQCGRSMPRGHAETGRKSTTDPSVAPVRP